MKNLFSAAVFAIVVSAFAISDTLAAAQPIPGVDISAKKNPGGFPKKPSGIVAPKNKKCPAGYVFVDDGRDGACELLKDVAASTIPDADSGSGSTSNKKMMGAPKISEATAVYNGTGAVNGGAGDTAQSATIKMFSDACETYCKKPCPCSGAPGTQTCTCPIPGLPPSRE